MTAASIDISPKRKLSLVARQEPLAAASAQKATLASLPLTREFDALVGDLRSQAVDIFQINVGKLCNQTCRHCHVDAGPDRTEENMSRETFEACLKAIELTGAKTVDITGGAPELNPNFRWFVKQVRAMDRHIIDRCNLTIIETNAHADLPEFFAEHQVEVACSLPHVAKWSTDRQRGQGVFEKSIRALQKLNAVGYGKGDPSKRLVLVTNPVGAMLPAGQQSLERDWRDALMRKFGVTFDSLITITNMPISRYLEWLVESDNLQGYMERLVNSYNPMAADNVMCKNTLSVGWDGQVYDCDFNQMLELPSVGIGHVRDLSSELPGRRIVTGRHCFGCTAGAGSSCGGATAQ